MATSAAVLDIQRRYGNRAVQRLLAQCQSSEEDSGLRPETDVQVRAAPKKGDTSSPSNGGGVERQILQMSWFSKWWAAPRGVEYQPVAGKRGWLWKIKKSAPETLIISSHGGYWGADPQVAAPTSIKFYSTLNDEAARRIQDHVGAQKGEARPGDLVEDYILSKFQEKHGGGSELYEDVCQVVQGGKGNIAVLTIRGGKELRYSDILGLMGNYSLVEALHCRSRLDHGLVKVMI